MFNKGQLSGLMKQAQAMQAKLQDVQNQLAQTEVNGEAGNGLVKITMTCKHQVRRVQVDESLLRAEAGQTPDKEMLEDLLTTAFNAAARQAEATAEAQMQSVGGLPAGMKLPF
jgi:DNA-binding YbaB/EbfC family protein